MKRWLKVFLVFCVCASGQGAFAEIDDDPPSHCTKDPNIPMALDEVTIFACRMGDKTLSLCGRQSKDLGGYQTMSYRFGRLGQPPELEYPKKPMPVWKAFRVSGLGIRRRPGFPTQGVIGQYRRKAVENFEKSTGVILPSGTYTEIAFSSGPYTYTFYDQIAGPKAIGGLASESENTGEGLVVEKSGEIIAHLPCSESSLDVNAGIEGKYFPNRIGHLIKGLYAKDDFKDEAKYFRGVAPQNQRFKQVVKDKGE